MSKYHHLILVGDSMIEFFDWQERFAGLEIDNLGQAGESVEGLEHRAKRIVKQFDSPDLLLVMIGTNNVAMENFSFLPAYEGILNTFADAWPDAKLVVNSLLPMELDYLAPDTVSRVNHSLKDLAGQCGASYLDVWSAMDGEKGHALEGVLEDEVHLSHMGYGIWAEVLDDFLRRG